MPVRGLKDAPRTVVPDRRARRDGDGVPRWQRDDPRRPVTRLAEPAVARPPAPRANEHRPVSDQTANRARGWTSSIPARVEAAAREPRGTVRPFPEAGSPSARTAPIALPQELAAGAPARREPPSAAPAEPQWPELPPDTTGSGDRERRTLVVGVRPAEGSGPWNALPF
jgi:hypothetical protein